MSAVLTFAAVPLAFASIGTPPGKVNPFEVWMWMFVFPAAAAKAMNPTNADAANTLIFLNPLIYGGIWWFAWRMWVLMRRKRPA